jgi:dTDP-glucose pyrophosphorylase
MKVTNFKQYCIGHEKSIRDTFKRMDNEGNKFVLVQDELGSIVGIVTDGDLRRAIWASIPLDQNVLEITNKKFIYFSQKDDLKSIQDIFDSTNIRQIPIVDEGKLVEVIFKEKLDPISPEQSSETMSLPVVIMAGGKGTRLEPVTKVLPKPLIPINGKPIIQIIMDEFNKFGMKEFTITLNDKGKMIKAYFYDHDLDYNIRYTEEDIPLGTAGALRLLPEHLDGPIMVTNCDIIIKSDYQSLYKFHYQRKNALTLVGSMQHYTIPYGICEIENGGDLLSIHEKPQYDFLTNTGLYIIEREAIELIPKDKYFDMTDLISLLKEQGFCVGVYPVSEKSWIDIGQWEEYRKALDALT